MELKLPRRYFEFGKPLQHFLLHVNESELRKFKKYEQQNFFEVACVVHRVATKCLCGNDNSYVISNVERLGYRYTLVLCRDCGLIRARDYWDKDSAKVYYRDWYRRITGGKHRIEDLYLAEVKKGKNIRDFVQEFLPPGESDYVVADIGGGVGGILSCFLQYNCYLFDYDEDFLNYALSKGVKPIKGGIAELCARGISPDLVILSNVLEHFIDPNAELEKLKTCLKLGSRVYVALPGIGSLKKGRRDWDFLADIQEHHFTYFCQETLTNLMNRLGFRCIKSNSEIQALYEITSKKGSLVNYHDIVVKHIRRAELIRRTYLPIKSFVSSLLPNFIKDRLRKYIRRTLS